MGAVVYIVDNENPIVPERVAVMVAANEEHAAPAQEDTTPDMSPTARVRHLNQIMEGDVITDDAPEVLRSHRLRYRFDTFMARGGASIFKVLTALFLGALLVIGAARGLVLWLAPELPLTHEDIGFFGNLYVTFLELTDPGNMVQDLNSSPWYKAIAVTAGMVGIVMLSALIAFITTALNQKLNELRRGRSKVIEEDHTLILGWNEQRIVEILHELTIANESEKDACAVILADKDKEEIDDVLRLRVNDLKTTRIVTRSGDVSTLANLDMVSIESAKSVIILASCDDTDSAEDKSASDAKGIQTVLATMGRATRDEEFSVVVEIFNPTHREIVRSSFPEHVVTVNTSDVLAKLLVQTSRSVGLSVVYNEILSFDGCEMYFYDAPWNNATFGDATFHFPDGVPIGIRTEEGEIVINPDHTRQLADGDEVLIIADDDSTIDFEDKPVAEARDFAVSSRRNQQVVERELMIGWNFKSPSILREFADYIIEGSQIDVLLKAPSRAAASGGQVTQCRDREHRDPPDREGLPEPERSHVASALRLRQHHYSRRLGRHRSRGRHWSRRFREHRCPVIAATDIQPVPGREPEHEADYGDPRFTELRAGRAGGRAGRYHLESPRQHDHGADLREP